MQYVEIAVNSKTSLTRQTFSYKIKPEQLPYIRPGILVMVPFRNRNVEGVILEIKHILPKNIDLKNITKIIDNNPIIDQIRLTLAKWMSEYYLAPIGDVIFAMIPPVAHRLAIKTLINSKNTITRQTNTNKIYTLYDRYNNRVKAYIKLIKKNITAQKNSLIIMPNMSSLNEFYDFTQKEFEKENIIVLHSGLSTTERYKTWLEILSNNKKIVIGTRSSIFAPLPNLGLIIIDEPEDYGYKDEQSPYYNVLTVAKKLSEIVTCNLVLGSIVINLELGYSVANKEFKEIKKPPESKIFIKLVDINNQKKIISYDLENEIKLSLENKNKILLFVNRKGSGSVYTCQDCKTIINCPKCNLPYSYFEKENGKLICSHCHTQTNPPEFCPNCNSIKLKPWGIGTESVQREIKKLFPLSKSVIIEKNLSPITLPTGRQAHNLLSEFDIVIATQKIFEYHDYNPDLTAIIQIDNSLSIPDFNTTENIFLQISKLRAMTSNKLLVQTYNPENIFLQNISDYESTLRYLLSERKKYNYPPFGKLIKLTYQNQSEDICEKEAQKLFKTLNSLLKPYSFQLFGPSPSFIAKKRNKYRYQIIIQSQHIQNIKTKLTTISGLSKWSIDVDPISLL